MPDRDLAVQVVRRVAPYLPILLAISASSPYWNGRDSGYASFRSLVWSRWPTAGPPAHVETAADYDALVADLIASGTISDPGMVYFDIRPSAHLPTVELRVCDACPDVEDVRADRRAVPRRSSAGPARTPRPACRCRRSRHELLRAAILAGGALRAGGRPRRPASARPWCAPPLLIGQLVDHLRPQLEELGDWEQVLELSQATLSRGSAAARQRRAYGRRGELTDVVDVLLAHTQGRTPAHRAAGHRAEHPAAARRLPRDRRRAPAFDEAVSEGGTVLPHYGWMFRALDRLGPRGLAAAESALRTEQRARGVTFRVGDGEPDRLFPLDLVPAHRHRRGLGRASRPGSRSGCGRWRPSCATCTASARSSPTAWCPPGSWTTRPAGTGWASSSPADAVRIAVAGIDLVRDRADRWCVLEDNLRVPSGIGYSIMSRRLIRSVDARPGAAGRACVGLEAVPGTAARGPALGHRAGRRPAPTRSRCCPPARRLGLLRTPAAGRPDGHPAGHPARAAGHRGRGVPGRHRRPAAAVGAVPPARRDEPAAPRGRRPAPDRPGHLQRGGPRQRGRCSTRWATAWPTTSRSTPTSRR